MIGRTNAGSGTGGLLINVVGGLSQPETPTYGTVWLETEVPINGWEILSVAPDWEAAEGHVYLQDAPSTSGDTPNFAVIDAAKKPYGAIWERLIGAFQRINGEWVRLNGAMWRDGVWTPFFEATINVTYPEGSVCTATDGVTTLTSDNSGSWAFVVPNAGTWTVSLDNGFSEDVVVTSNGQIATIDKWYLYKSGNEYTDRTGGWSKGVHTVSDGLGTVTKKIDTVYFHIPDIEHDDCPLATLNKVDLSKFKTLCAEYEKVSCTNSSFFYLVASYLTIRGLSGSSGAVKHEFYNGGSNQIVAADISNVGVPNYVTVGIFSYDTSKVNTAYLKSVWAM